MDKSSGKANFSSVILRQAQFLKGELLVIVEVDFFTGRKPFLLQKQQHQNTEG